MNRREVKKADLPDLVSAYAEAAAEQGQASEKGNHKRANPKAEEIAAIYRELRERGRDAQLALLPLLEHPDPFVRGWTAAHALEFAPVEGERALLALVELPGVPGLNASMTLREWRQGTLRFP
jgi:hypothetical protein